MRARVFRRSLADLIAAARLASTAWAKRSISEISAVVGFRFSARIFWAISVSRIDSGAVSFMNQIHHFLKDLATILEVRQSADLVAKRSDSLKHGEVLINECEEARVVRFRSRQ